MSGDRYDLAAYRVLQRILTDALHHATLGDAVTLDDRNTAMQRRIADALRQQAQDDRALLDEYRATLTDVWFRFASTAGGTFHAGGLSVLEDAREVLLRDGIIDAAGRAVTTPPAPEEGVR